MSDTVSPVAWIAVRDALELRKHGRREAVLYSESVGIDIPLYEESAVTALQSRIAELEQAGCHPWKDALEGTVLKMGERIAELEKDAARFRSLNWQYTEDRDMGPGGYWRATVSTKNSKIRNDKLAVIDAAIEATK